MYVGIMVTLYVTKNERLYGKKPRNTAGEGGVLAPPQPKNKDLRKTKRHSLMTTKKRCKCGGKFVKPSELGFDGGGILICDNEDRGDGQPCEEWIVDDGT